MTLSERLFLNMRKFPSIFPMISNCVRRLSSLSGSEYVIFWQTALREKNPNANTRKSFILFNFQRFYIIGGKVIKVHSFSRKLYANGSPACYYYCTQTRSGGMRL